MFHVKHTKKSGEIRASFFEKSVKGTGTIVAMSELQNGIRMSGLYIDVV